ncbi:MAG: hypothetical protein ACE5J6_03675 [Candidatus Bathyarchaeia archaeon]
MTNWCWFGGGLLRDAIRGKAKMGQDYNKVKKNTLGPIKTTEAL